jgi:AmpD protein
VPGLRRHHPIDAIAGHEHIAPGRKHDPDPASTGARCCALRWPRAFYPDGVLG